MSFKHSTDQRNQIIRVFADEPFEFRSIFAAIIMLARDPNLNAGFGVLFDLRNMKDEPTSVDLFRFSDIWTSLRTRFRGDVKFLVLMKSLHAAQLLCILLQAAGIKASAATLELSNALTPRELQS